VSFNHSFSVTELLSHERILAANLSFAVDNSLRQSKPTQHIMASHDIDGPPSGYRITSRKKDILRRASQPYRKDSRSHGNQRQSYKEKTEDDLPKRRHRTKVHRHPQDDLPNLKKKAYNGKELVHTFMEHTQVSSLNDNISDGQAKFMLNPESRRFDSQRSMMNFVKSAFRILDKVYFFEWIKGIVMDLKVDKTHPKH
jgi:hypothetical protein